MRAILAWNASGRSHGPLVDIVIVLESPGGIGAAFVDYLSKASKDCLGLRIL